MSGLMLVPKRKERLGDVLYGQILEQIVSGALVEGDKLPSEQQICQSFNVSRPVVREALLRLHADGLVVSRQGSGTFVQRRPSDRLTQFASISDIAGMLRCMEVRMALEGQAAALAARRHTPQTLDEIVRAQAAMRDSFTAGDVPHREDFGFHLAVAKASGNEMFAEVLRMLQGTALATMQVALSLTRAGSKERAARVMEEHLAIIDAITNRDPDAADLAMRYHIDRARQRLTNNQRDA